MELSRLDRLGLGSRVSGRDAGQARPARLRAAPLLRAVSLDRAFYRALSVAQYVTYAAQVPSDFRFIVKAPALVCDAQTRDEAGRAFQANSGFLDPELALRTFAQPAVEGLGTAIAAGASVYVWWAGRELRPE